MTRITALLTPALLTILGLMTVLGGRPFFSPDALFGLYQISPDSLSQMELALLRHRAIMVSVVGSLLWVCLIRRDMIRMLVPLVMLSKTLFVLTLWPVRAQAMTVIWFDSISVVLLALILVLHVARPRHAASDPD